MLQKKNGIIFQSWGNLLANTLQCIWVVVMLRNCFGEGLALEKHRTETVPFCSLPVSQQDDKCLIISHSALVFTGHLVLCVLLSSESSLSPSNTMLLLFPGSAFYSGKTQMSDQEMSGWVRCLLPSPTTKFNSQDPHGRRRALTSTSCPLTSSWTLLSANTHTEAHTCMYITYM